MAYVGVCIKLNSFYFWCRTVGPGERREDTGGWSRHKSGLKTTSTQRQLVINLHSTRGRPGDDNEALFGFPC